MDFAHDWNLKTDAHNNDLSPSDLKQKRFAHGIVSAYLRVIPGLCAGESMSIKVHNKNTKHTNALLTVGGEQSGKTMVGALAARRAIECGFTAKVYDWYELVQVLF